jgi:hypothetical protein
VVWPEAIGANRKDFWKASPSELLKGAFLSFSIAWTASGACEITFFGMSAGDDSRPVGGSHQYEVEPRAVSSDFESAL